MMRLAGSDLSDLPAPQKSLELLDDRSVTIGHRQLEEEPVARGVVCGETLPPDAAAVAPLTSDQAAEFVTRAAIEQRSGA